MGIRFICEACNKRLHVKSFLAGKRGVCPHCGAKVQIPGEEPAEALSGSAPSGNGFAHKEPVNGRPPASADLPVIVSQPRRGSVAAHGEPAPQVTATRSVKSVAPLLAKVSQRDDRSSKPAAKARPQPLESQPLESQPLEFQPLESPLGAEPMSSALVDDVAFPDFQPLPTVAEVAAGTPMAAHVSAPAVNQVVEPSVGPASVGPASQGPVTGASRTASVPAAPSVSPPQPPAGTASNPIDESPGSSWYVQPPSGGQYGPARGDIMRKWLDEGRVSADSLVWREGWDDWRLAGTVFPELSPTPAAAPAPAVVVPAVSPASKEQPAAATRARRRKSNGSAIAIFVGLVLVSVALLGILIFVLLRK